MKQMDCLKLDSFLKHANYTTSEGIPEIIIMSAYLLVGNEILDFYFEKLLMSESICKIEEWPKEMPQDPSYFLFCHKQIRKDLNEDNPKLMPKTVIRRDLQVPIVMSIFRTNALQHAVFFHNYLNQSVSYNKIRDSEGHYPSYKVHKMLLLRIDPLFSQLCDPYTSYNEGVYGITLRQFTSQSKLLFGVESTYLGERIFSYLLKT